MTEPSESDKPARAAEAFMQDLRVVRCSGCGKIICKSTREAVRTGQVIEIKCGCNQLNYLMGRFDET